MLTASPRWLSGGRLLCAALACKRERLLSVRAARLLPGGTWSTGGSRGRSGFARRAACARKRIWQIPLGCGFDGRRLERGATAGDLGEYQPAERACGRAMLGDGMAQ